jgi:hypothetical protein
MEIETMKMDEDRPTEGMRGARVLTGAVLSLVALSFSCATPAKSEAYLAGRSMGTVQSEALDELSGLAASRRNPGVLWVHNDSGDAPRVYALNERAQLLGACDIRGATERDWEDIAVGPGPDPNRSYLYLGDIGDNGGRRPEVVVYRVPEPKVDAATPFGRMTIGPADVLRFTYPDGPRDAETLLVDPLSRDLYVISKRDLVPRVYRAAYPQARPGPTRLEQVAVLPLGTFPTGGDVSPDGCRVIVRGMFQAALWDRPGGGGAPATPRPAAGKSKESPPGAAVPQVEDPVPLWLAFSGPPQAIPVAPEPQGEAICFDCRGKGYFTISEGKHPSLYYFGPAEPNTPR